MGFGVRGAESHGFGFVWIGHHHQVCCLGLLSWFVVLEGLLHRSQPWKKIGPGDGCDRFPELPNRCPGVTPTIWLHDSMCCDRTLYTHTYEHTHMLVLSHNMVHIFPSLGCVHSWNPHQEGRSN